VVTLCLGTGIFLVVLLGLFLPAMAPFLLGPRAAAAALEERRPDEQLVVYKARDDELLFYLPSDAISIRPRSELEALVAKGTPFLGIGRAEDVGRLIDEQPHLDLVLFDGIDGVELGRVRWSRIYLFRPFSPDMVSPDVASDPVDPGPDAPAIGAPADAAPAEEQHSTEAEP
jgi:hypothetical protein